MPIDACRDGEPVVGPELVGGPEGNQTSSFTFELDAPSAVCVVANSVGAPDEDDEDCDHDDQGHHGDHGHHWHGWNDHHDDQDHAVSAAWIEIDDELLIGPERFNQQVQVVEQATSLEAGTHLLSVRVAGPKHAALEVEVKAAPGGVRHGLVRSKHLELFNLRSNPTAVTSGNPTVTLSAEGQALRLNASSHPRWTLRFAFEVRDLETCRIVRVLRGEIPLDGPSTFVAEATWDGRASDGTLLPDGRYAYRLRTQLVREGHHDKVIDRLSTAYQEVRVDRAGPPSVSIESPTPGALVGRIVTVSGSVVGGVQVDRVTIDGIESAIDQGSWLTKITLEDGAHTITARVIDLFGRVATASVDVFVDREANRQHFIEQFLVTHTETLDNGTPHTRAAVRIGDDERFVYAAGSDLAPECDGLTDPREFMTCVIGSFETLLEFSGEAPSADSWEVVDVHSADLGLGSIRVKQRVGGLDVRDADLTVSRHEARAFRLAGRLFVPSELPPSLAGLEAPAPQVLSAAELQTGRSLTLHLRTFDPGRGAVLSRLVVDDEPNLEVLFDERTLEVIGMFDTASGLDTEVKRTTIVHYGSLDAYSAAGSQEVSVEVPWLPFIGDQCAGRLEVDGSDSGQPKVVNDPDADRGGGAYIEIVPCAEERFMHADLGSAYAVGASENLGRLMNAFFWLSDLHTFANVTAGYGDWPILGQAHARVMVQPEETGGCTRTTPDGAVQHVACVLTDGVMLLPGPAAWELYTMAHEYGHVVQHLMDRATPLGNFSGRSVGEGFAESNVARYTMYRVGLPPRSFDPIAEQTYLGSSWDGRTRHMHTIEAPRGEYLPGVQSQTAGPDTTAHELGMIYNANSAVCSANPNPYACGSVLPLVYWELAGNACRLPYDRFLGQATCALETPIVQTSALDSETLVNIVYGFTMRSFSYSDESVGDFMTDVTAAFDTLERAGFIGADDYLRVVNVLAHHCVGWDNGCEKFHKLPEDRVPRAFTRKASFAAGDRQQLIMANEMNRQGSPAPESEPGAPLNDTPFMRLTAGDRLVTVVEVPDDVELPPGATAWRLRGALRAGSGSCAEPLTVQVDNLSSVVWDTTGWGASFAWSDAGPRWQLTPGAHSIRINAACGTTDLDALLLDRGAVCVPECAGHECGLDPICGVQCPCCSSLTCADHLCGGPFPDGCGGQTEPCAACPAGRDWLDDSGDSARPSCDIVGGEARLEQGVGGEPGRVMLRTFFDGVPDLASMALRWAFSTRVLADDGTEVIAHVLITLGGFGPGYFIFAENTEEGTTIGGGLCALVGDGYALNSDPATGALELIIEERLIRPRLERVGEIFDYSMDALCQPENVSDRAPENGDVRMNTSPLTTLPPLPSGVSLCE